MNELTKKLKDNIIKSLLSNEHNINDSYLLSKGRSWTRSQIAQEIENETEFGIDFMSDMLSLSLDLIARQKA